MKKVLVLLFIFSFAHADQYQDLLRDYNHVYAEQLRNKVQNLPKKSFIEVSLKNGSVILGTFEGFSKYDDSVWILPQWKHGLFSDESYDIRSLENIRVVEPI